MKPQTVGNDVINSYPATDWRRTRIAVAFCPLLQAWVECI